MSLKNTSTYEFNTGIGGDEDGAFIKRPAQHFEESKIIRDSSTGWVAVYKYKPRASFVGTDSVEIETHEGSDGASAPQIIKVIRINFDVTE